MAIFSYNADIITRSKKGAGGARVERRSAVAASAYISGERLVQSMERNPFGVDMEEKAAGLEKVHDYCARVGDVAYKAIFTPEGAPDWTKERQELWNHVENAEKRVDAQLCRTVNCALPRELNHEQHVKLISDFVQEAFVSKGMIADVSFHYDAENHNPHAHFLLTMRQLEGDHFSAAKCKEWQPDFVKNGHSTTVGKELMKIEGEAWSRHCNDALEQAGSDARITHLSFEERGIDRTPAVHLGKAHYMEQKNVPTRLGAETQVIEAVNQLKEGVRRVSGSSRRTVSEPGILQPSRSLLIPVLQDIWHKTLEVLHWFAGIDNPYRQMEQERQHHNDRGIEYE